MRAIIFDCFGVIVSAGVDEGVISIIKNLKENYKIAVLSNTNRRWFDDVLDEECQKLFDVVVLSEESGVGKPDQRAFLETARRLEEFPSDCLMIDDSGVNCAAAEQAGMRSIHFTNSEELKRELSNYGILTP